jgi:hypothetical protein
VQTLAGIMRGGESDAVRRSAASDLLDRAYGKAPQAIIGGGEDDPAVRVITEIRRSIVDSRNSDG